MGNEGGRNKRGAEAPLKLSMRGLGGGKYWTINR